MSCRQASAYAAKAAAAASMARASSVANALPFCETVRASVASATEGAAPKMPANVFGFSMSASEALEAVRSYSIYCTSSRNVEI